ACGRCSGHRDAVDLAARAPNAEILAAKTPPTAEAILLIFGMLGVAIGAFQWTINPWFVKAKQATAGWLIDRDILWPLDTDAPWWLLTHQTEAGDFFAWLDGALILAYIAGVAAALGGLVWLSVVLAARLARLDWRALALGLTPLAGIGLFLGLSMMSATHLRAEGLPLSWLPAMRGALLATGVLWAGWLGARMIAATQPGPVRGTLALAAWAVPLAAVAASWILTFYVW
ncbi:MAG: 4Fe-4S binding protein, partial [Rhodocyclaceae bacterium]|nr:4Fe-4S binding protein [Rhodocyclaceae bacterium]